MSTSNPQTRAASLTNTGRGADTRFGRDDLSRFGPNCHQCGAAVRFVHAEPGDRGWHESQSLRSGTGKRTVIEHVRCPDCGAGGCRVKLAEDDRVVRKFGPATRTLRGRSGTARERGREEYQRAREAPPVDAALAAGWSE